jgi:hypothetical protein
MPDQPESPPPPLPEGPAADPPEAASEVDPELERLPLPRRPRSVLAVLAVLSLSIALLVHLAPDLRYAAAESTPQELPPARSLRAGDAGDLRDNTLVAVSGLPDYRNALLFEPKGDSYRRSFYRMLGSGSRLWVRAEETSTRHQLAERIVGRLRGFDTLPYAEQVRGYYGALKVTRLLDLGQFQRRSRGEIGDGLWRELRDRGGEPVAVGDPAREQAAVVVDFPDELVVILPGERFAVEEDARREVLRLGVAAGPGKPDKEGFRFVVRVGAAGRDALMAACEQRDFGVELHRERYRVPLAALGLPPPATGPAGLSLDPPADAAPFLVQDGNVLSPAPPGPRVVPWERVDSIQIDAPVVIPHDAWVVIEGDVPSGYGWARALAVVLLLFIAFNGWLLTRSLRGR